MFRAFAHPTLAGETAVRDLMNHGGSIATGGEPKRQFVFRWLREKESDRQARELRTERDVRWTFWAAIAAVVVGVIGVAVTLFNH